VKAPVRCFAHATGSSEGGGGFDIVMGGLKDRGRSGNQDRAHSRRTVFYRSLAVKEGGVGERWFKE